MRMNWQSRRIAGLLVAFSVVLFAADDCTIDLGNLEDLVVTYDVSVTNNGPDNALVLMIGKDIRRRALVPPGGTVTATSFAGGDMLLSVSPTTEYIDALKQRRDAVIAKLSAKPLDLAASLSITNELSILGSTIRDYESRGHGSLCSVTLKPNDKGKGIDVHATTSFEQDKWTLAC